MNKNRRERIKEVLHEVEAQKQHLEEIMEEEEGYRDDTPENLQSSERFQESETYIDLMDSAVDGLSEAIEYLKDIQ